MLHCIGDISCSVLNK